MDQITSFKPAFLSLVLGLVLTEEVSISWLNTSMMIRAAPSVSAHSLMSPMASDLLRKLVVFILAIAAIGQGLAQQVLTVIGISLACIVLLANLGARGWHFMRWRPQRYDGPLASVLAYITAVLTGAVLPYMGHRNIEVGGKAGMEYVIRTAFFVAVAFIISDIDAVQNFLVLGSEVSVEYWSSLSFRTSSRLTMSIMSCSGLQSRRSRLDHWLLVVCYIIYMSIHCTQDPILRAKAH